MIREGCLLQDRSGRGTGYVLALKSRGYLGKISLSNVPCTISREPLDWGVFVLTLQPDKE